MFHLSAALRQIRIPLSLTTPAASLSFPLFTEDSHPQSPFSAPRNELTVTQRRLGGKARNLPLKKLRVRRTAAGRGPRHCRQHLRFRHGSAAIICVICKRDLPSWRWMC